MEIRGIYFRAVKEAFPYLEEIVGRALSAPFEGVDADGWYDAAPFYDVMEYLTKHVSPQAMMLIGMRWSEIFKDKIFGKGISTPEELAEKVPALYRDVVRGEGAGDWTVVEYRAGRAVVREVGKSAGVAFAAGVIKAALEAVGAINVRVSVLEDQARGAAQNRFLAEWVTPGAAARPQTV